MDLESAVGARALHLPSDHALRAGWSWLSLGDGCEGVFDCPHSTPQLEDSGPLVVRSQDIITGVFRVEQAARVSEKTYQERIARATPTRGDLLYSREGTYFGIAAEVPADTRVCLGQRMVLIRPKAAVLDFRYLRHWLNSPIMASHVHGFRDGSVAQRLNLPTIRALPILVPPLAEQQGIANTLGAVEDKIELNRRMSETLESMASDLFKSWFVDFDPVRAKMEGRDAGLPKQIADLVPDRLVECELGEIPVGWEASELGRCLALLRDGSHNPPKRVEQGIRFIAGATDVKRFCIDFSKCTFITRDNYESLHRKWRVEAGDVLLTIVGTVGNVAVVTNSDLPFSLQRSIAVLRPGSNVSSAFLYFLLQSPKFQTAVESRLNPTAQPGIYLGTLAAIPICLPPPDVVKAFDYIGASVVARMQTAVSDSRALVAVRDALLPRLLSGELRVVRREA